MMYMMMDVCMILLMMHDLKDMFVMIILDNRLQAF